jgi:hypothetical protein
LRFLNREEMRGMVGEEGGKLTGLMGRVASPTKRYISAAATIANSPDFSSSARKMKGGGGW